MPWPLHTDVGTDAAVAAAGDIAAAAAAAEQHEEAQQQVLSGQIGLKRTTFSAHDGLGWYQCTLEQPGATHRAPLRHETHWLCCKDATLITLNTMHSGLTMQQLLLACPLAGLYWMVLGVTPAHSAG